MTAPSRASLAPIAADRAVLPIGTPPISTYLFYMYPLSILARDSGYLPWFYENYIQLFHRPGGDLKFCLHERSLGVQLQDAYHTSCPYLTIRQRDQRELAALPGWPIRYIEDEIAAGRYVQLDVDYLYVPERDTYRGSHFVHELLVSAFDAGRRRFRVTGFDPQGIYKATVMTYDEMERAVESTSTLDLDRPDEWPDDRPSVFVYTVDEATEECVDLASIRGGIEEYLQGICNTDRFGLPLRPADSLWGIDVYDFLLELVSDVANAHVARVPLRLLVEHKRTMRDRLRYLADAGLLELPQDAWTNLEEVETKAAHARNVVLRAWSRRRPYSVPVATNALESAREMEESALTLVLTALDCC